MDEYEVSTYPSRSFIRFTARNQLIADLTGRAFPMIVKRFGGETYVQKIIPSDQPETDQPGFTGPDNASDLEGALDLFSPLMGPEDSDLEPPSSEESQATEINNDADAMDPNCDLTQQPGAIDDVLFREIAKTLFNCNRNPELYQTCGNKQAAAVVETRIVEEIVETYKQIKLKQDCPVVQSLNALL